MKPSITIWKRLWLFIQTHWTKWSLLRTDLNYIINQSVLKNENTAWFSNLKVIIYLICVACVKVSIECVVESLVSRYEKHFDSSFKHIGRNDHCWERTLIERTMNQYWKATNNNSKLHFLRLTEDICLYIEKLEVYIRLSDSCWTKSLNYHSCKTVRVRYDIV